jgi:Methyltransferase domain
MQHIRPHQALHLFETPSYYDRLVNVVLPDQRSPMLLESMILLALAKHVQPDVIFEFGTFLGITTFQLAVNMAAEGIIYTLDLDAHAFEKICQHPSDRMKSISRFEYESRLAFVNTPYESRIKRLLGDSNVFNFAPFQGKVNMVYIDGGHDRRTARSDTRNAFSMLDTARRGCIAWHDYRNPEFPDLTEFLDEVSVERELQHVEETMTVFFLHEP